jgi:3-methyl-2-oxobutanoate hydroxymethyltransferase
MITKVKNIINKKNKSPLVCLTAYSKTISQILDKYCDIILVGDSLANVLYAMNNTHQISLNTMIRHAYSVRQGIKKSLCVVDMPKNTYNNIIDAKKNAKKILRKTKCHAVKIEDNGKNEKIIKSLVKLGIPVMGHIGYTPQFKKKFKIQGKTKLQEKKLINRAIKIEQAGAFSIVLECIKTISAKEITKNIKIPTIGIGASKYCDGQILVTDDLLGLSGFKPKFVKQYGNIKKIIEKSVQHYKKEVINKNFPKKNNSY